jgi:hypothetical protein
MSGSAGDSTNPIADLGSRIRDVESRLNTRSEVVRNAPDPVARQRDWIGKVIIAVFALAIFFGLLLLVPEGLMAEQGAQSDAWKNVALQSADLIKSALLPVVTLVLGYYFGQSSRS